ncbi:MAG TPA: cytochrome c biogenesis protein CcdA [Solirubrobacteraceae bacterium]|nr:cytochrome c biogenesis protein CcdA [Solirubrobacteraceae bacterium]
MIGAAAVLASSSDTATGVGIPLALTAGLVSFLSPCVLPLVPGYLSTVAGVSPAEIADTKRRKMLIPSLLFIAGFSIVFILMGLAATAIGSTLDTNRGTLEHAAGALIVVMGVAFLASPFMSALPLSWRPRSKLLADLRLAAGRGGPLLIGAAFAIAWTPCTSITLGAITAQAAVAGSEAHGALLLAFYSAGLAIPFLLLTLAFERVTGALAVVKRHFPVVIGLGGAVMIALGLLILTGEFTVLNSQANSLLHGTGLDVSGV